MNKYDKILIVKKLGFNTEESILIKSDKELALVEAFTRKLDAISLRTLHQDGDRIKSPHYPIVTKGDIFSTIRSVLSRGFWCIVATPIDPRHASYAGCALKEGKKLILELVEGAYTVRRVTHEGFIDLKYIYPDDRTIMLQKDAKLIDVADKAYKIPFDHCIIELSYYKIPVGWKKEHVIIWNLDDDGTGIGMKQMERFYKE